MNIVFVRQNWKSLSHGNFVIGSGSGAVMAPCALGKGGLTALKREGDGATPIGCFRVMNVYYRPDKIHRPQTRLPVHPITDIDGWCDESSDRNYNKYITIPYPSSHEALKRRDHLYDLMVVLDYNISERKRCAGSAIFFHLAHSDYRPTEGCIAVNEKVMRYFLKRANSNTRFIIKR